MKKVFLLILLLGSISISFAQSFAEKEIRDYMYKSAKDWSSGNLDEFMKGYWDSDSVMYIGGSKITYGYQNILNAYKRSFPDTASMGKLAFELINVKELSPEYYIVTGKYLLTRIAENANGMFTLLFRKINGRWLIVYDHSS
jgi:uncharacterized protein (TIGR02246 family)